MIKIKPSNKSIYHRDGFAIVAFGWILISFFGALPFFVSGEIPSFVDSLFESISGFTTTGSSILSDVQVLPKGILFWRSFTHWIGGMGVLVLTLAILPSVGAKTYNIMKAESPGPTMDKIVPRIGQTAKILYGIYTGMTVILIILLLIAGMPFYDSMIHAFGTAGTGGFSNMNASVGAYNSVYIEVIITCFMLLFGINFSLYYCLIKGNFKSIFRNEELRTYLGVVLVSIILIGLNTYGSIFKSGWQALRHSSFQVASIITTTGFASNDFNLWPVFSKYILLLLMFIGASASSTGGGIKVVRIVLLFKTVKRELIKIIHPRSVYSVRYGDKAVEEETVSGVLIFFFIYMFIFALAVLIISFDCDDFITSISSVACTIGNIGPGFGLVGATGNFSGFSDLSKLVLSMCMIIGRLEIFPILLLITPSFWKRVNI